MNCRRLPLFLGALKHGERLGETRTRRALFAGPIGTAAWRSCQRRRLLLLPAEPELWLVHAGDAAAEGLDDSTKPSVAALGGVNLCFEREVEIPGKRVEAFPSN